jgi:hypothetical protein
LERTKWLRKGVQECRRLREARSYIHYYIAALHIPALAYIMRRVLKLWVRTRFHIYGRYKIHDVLVSLTVSLPN